MKLYANDRINDYIYVAGNPIYPGYVIKGGSKNLMIDAGINLFGPLYIKSIENLCGNKNNLDYLFITHSHYDHLGSVPYLKRNILNLKIGGADNINKLLKKESVIERMNSLSEMQRGMFAQIVGDEDVHLESIDLDYNLKEGDTFDLGSMTCEVYETPGHTRDSLAYYIPELGALFPGEAAGVPYGKEANSIQVEFLSSYDDYIHSIEKLIKLNPKIVGIGHGFVLTEDDASIYLNNSYKATAEYRKLIEDYLDGVHGDVDNAIAVMMRKEYDEKGTIMQERNAYRTNLTAQVKHIAGLRGIF